jgi:gamma-glutamyltranspeptidase/glutathione hydrolase
MGRTSTRHRRLLGAASLCLGWAGLGTAGLGAVPALADAPSTPHRHMIVTPNHLATEAGLAILREGGGAIDAAVAAAAVLAVVRPDQSGLGGGGILLYFDAATRRVTVWDGRETAPAAASPDLFLDASGQLLDAAASGQGGRAVGAPGLLRMLDAAQLAHGKLPWERLFAAATDLAENGTPVSNALAAAIAGETRRLSRQASARAALLRPDGTPLPAGTPFVNKPLAETLRAIAAGRSDALLAGPIAAEIATTVRTDANPGLLTVDDLGALASVERDPVCLAIGARRVCGAGPPSSGGVAILESLGLLARVDGTGDPAGMRIGAGAHPAPMGLEAAHLLVEAERLAQADAAFYLGDPAFVRAPVAGLLAADYLSRRAGLIDPLHALIDVQAGTPPWEEPEPRAAPPDQPRHGTTGLVAIDDSGNAVSLGADVQDRFGSGLLVHGFLLNDALTAFSPLPTRNGIRIANQVEPGKRPLTPMAPAMVFDAEGHLEYVLGASGGGRVAAGITQMLATTLGGSATPAAAIAQPRIGARDNVAELEANTAAVALAPGLREMGHRTATRPAHGGLAMIHVTSAGLDGAADPRDAEADCAGD